jgi:Domain of unknown function (DUF932)
MRHVAQVEARSEANEIILINSHDGASSYQMLAGVFRLCLADHRRNWGRAGRALRSSGAGRPSGSLRGIRPAPKGEWYPAAPS